MKNLKSKQDRERFNRTVYGDRPATHFDDALDFASAETRYFLLDAIACSLHNNGYAMQNNTEANDVQWLARTIFFNVRGEHLNQAWEILPDAEKERYYATARATIVSLPMFLDRMANRYLNLKQALNLLLRAEEYYKAKGFTYADKDEI